MNFNFSVSTALSALAATAFLPTYMSEARADETSVLFEQSLLTETCVKRGNAEPKARIAACSELIQIAKLAGPEMALAYLNRAAAYKATGNQAQAASDYAEALRRFDNLVDENQPVAQIVYQRAVAYQALGQVDRALASYGEAIRLDPTNPMPLVDRANALLRHKGRLADAIRDFTLALALSPNNADALMGRGDAYGRNGDFALALADLNRAIVLVPDNANAHVLRGLLNSRRGDSQSAATDYDAALVIDPRNMDALINRAALYSIAGQQDKALVDLDAAIAIRPNEPLAFYNRGYVHFSRKQYELAIADYSSAIDLDATFAIAYNNRCLALVLAGRNVTEAMVDCDKAFALTPNSVDVRDTRGLIYLKSGKPALAIAEYDAALKLDPKRALALYGRGLARIKMGDAQGGASDRTAAALLDADVNEQFLRYGLDK
jgi:tetratricopeptide (TPR) repeat protein